VASAKAELSKILEQRFVDRFNSMKKVKLWLSAPRPVLVRVKQRSFLVGLKKSRFSKDEWIVQVGPMDSPPGYSDELLLICREIHTLLAAKAGISAMRWYFEGFHSRSEAVATPDQLPWTPA
jgi:hypothetical protein